MHNLSGRFFFFCQSSTSNISIIQVSSSIYVCVHAKCVCVCVRACTCVCLCAWHAYWWAIWSDNGSQGVRKTACASAAKKKEKKNRQSNVNHVLTMPFFVFERTVFKLHTGLPLCDFRDPGWVEFIVGWSQLTNCSRKNFTSLFSFFFYPLRLFKRKKRVQ